MNFRIKKKNENNNNNNKIILLNKSYFFHNKTLTCPISGYAMIKCFKYNFIILLIKKLLPLLFKCDHFPTSLVI